MNERIYMLMHTRAPQRIQPPPPRKDEVLTIRLDADLAASVKALVAANGGNLSHHLRQLMQGAVAGYDPRKEEQRAISLLSAAGYGITRPGRSAASAEAKTYDQPAERRKIISDTCELAEDCTDDELLDAVRAINAQVAAAGEEPAEDEDESEREELERLRRESGEDALTDFERRDAAKIADPEARRRFVAARLARKAKHSK